jgi:fluoride exporter
MASRHAAARPRRGILAPATLSFLPPPVLRPALSAMSVTPIVPTPAMVTSLSTFGQACLVAAGGTVGCLLRWQAGVLFNSLPLPIAAGTLLVNVVGGLVMGFMIVLLERSPSEAWRLLLVTGVLGGMTTFSAFTGESLTLLVKGQVGIAVMHTAVHVFGALFAAALGWQIGRWVLA